MRKLRIQSLLLGLVALCGLFACSGSKEQQEADFTYLRPTLLGGVYFYAGYGGVDKVYDMYQGTGYTRVEAYKELFIDPFENGSSSDARNTLKEAWGITDSIGLVKEIDELRTQESKHKGWDLARAVNIAWMGVSAKFISKETALEQIKPLVPVAQAKFADWKSYFEDFLAGRKEWDPDGDPEDLALFTKTVKELLENPKSIYQEIPLK